MTAPLPGALASLGWDATWAAELVATELGDAQPGRVVRHDAAAVLVGMGDGQRHVHLGGYGAPLAVGDWVAVAGETVAAVLPRRSLLRRRDPMDSSEQLLAANVDVVLAVAGLDRPLKHGRLQRFLTLAVDAGARPVIVLTKGDLLEDPEAVRAEVAGAHPEAEVLWVAAHDGRLGPLAELVAGSTVVLVGESGAGKSTLVNLLMGSEVAKTADVRAGDSKGRHTTTARHLHVLERGGCLIDTPGIRSVGLWVDPAAVLAGFEDIEELGAKCRFRDCRHDQEPDCAVKAAATDGSLDPDRLAAWARLQSEADSAAIRADEQARRQVDRSFGRMARQVQRDKRRLR